MVVDDQAFLYFYMHQSGLYNHLSQQDIAIYPLPDPHSSLVCTTTAVQLKCHVLVSQIVSRASLGCVFHVPFWSKTFKKEIGHPFKSNMVWILSWNFSPPAQAQATVQVAPAPCFFLLDLKKSFIVFTFVSREGPVFDRNLRIKFVQWEKYLQPHVCLFLPLITLK